MAQRNALGVVGDGQEEALGEHQRDHGREADERQAHRDREAAPRPGAAGPIAKSGDACSRRGGAAGVEEAGRARAAGSLGGSCCSPRSAPIPHREWASSPPWRRESMSFLSPCVLPLVPGYLSAVTGVSASEIEDAGWRQVMGPSLVFVASFSAIFNPPRALGDRSRLPAGRKQAAADQDLRLADHRDGRPLRRLALHHPAEPRVARRRPAGTRRQRAARSSPAPPSRSPGPRASARPWARSSPPPPAPGRPLAAPSCWRSTRPAWRSPSSPPPWPSLG